uniref:Uncharacterized protein n=1 Tax=Paramoeba aestuarina TaxID=180227 RepID=A0A7S4KGQ7_9EUKA|mmetsp:Transcript_18952/g.29728  ORF Transcript_18952/g.29728 Transcript_18952/m.29728 type:complete len:113 (+) Transcript_18952:113-451(+)
MGDKEVRRKSWVEEEIVFEKREAETELEESASAPASTHTETEQKVLIAKEKKVLIEKETEVAAKTEETDEERARREERDRELGSLLGELAEWRRKTRELEDKIRLFVAQNPP